MWAKKRAEIGIPLDAFLLISVGELNTNKNNGVIISAMEKLRNPHFHYILCGVGDKQKELQEQADKVGLHDNVHFLGYRNDVKDLYETSDCFVMPSFREGLSRSIMEAMAIGLPCIVSKIRGNVDLIENGKGGFLCKCNNSSEFSEAIYKIYRDKAMQTNMGMYNRQMAVKYDIKRITYDILTIYKNI